MMHTPLFYVNVYILRMWGRSLTAPGRFIIVPMDSIVVLAYFAAPYAIYNDRYRECRKIKRKNLKIRIIPIDK